MSPEVYPAALENYTKLILVDCDGVLLDWNSSFHNWATDLKGLTLVNAFSYSIHERYGLSAWEEGHALTEEFNNSSSWISSLRPHRDAVEAVRGLHFRHGYRFRVISSLSDSRAALLARKKNLYSLFGAEPWEQIICLPCGAEKVAELLPFADTGTFFVEDKVENAVLAKNMGLRPILSSAAYNCTTAAEGIPRYAEWSQISEHILLSPSL